MHTRAATALTAIATAATILCAGPSRAEPLDEAAARFTSSHPDARLTWDEGGLRSVWGFAAETGEADPVAAARRFVTRHGALLGLKGGASGVEIDRSVSHLGSSHVTFRQTIHGLPVFGAGIAVHVDADGRVVSAVSSAVSAPAEPPSPLVEPAAAAAAAASLVRGETEPISTTLGYLAVERRALPAYMVVVPEVGPHVWMTFVSADSGIPIVRRDAVIAHAANVYLENPEVDDDLTEVVLGDFVDEEPHSYHTYGDYIRAASCESLDYYTGECSSWTHNAVATGEDGFLLEAPVFSPQASDDGFSEVQTYYSLNEYYAWWREEFDFEGGFYGVQTETPGDHIWVFVNAGFENGYFMGSYPEYGMYKDLIMLGQGEKDFAYDNDVTRHEFTHAVSHYTFHNESVALDSYGVSFMGMAVEEGNADYFPCSRHGNPALGEYLGVGRNLDNENVCPTDLTGESHHDGQIIGGTIWEIREHVGEDKANHLQYGALANTVSLDEFGEYADGLAMQAFAMTSTGTPDELRFTPEEVDFVSQVVEERNLEFCERFVPLPPGSTKMHYSAYQITYGGTPSAVQYVITTGSDTSELRLHVDRFADSYTVLVSEGDPVLFTWTRNGWTTDHDMEWDSSPDVAVVSKTTDLEVQPNTEYYFSITCLFDGGYGCMNYLSSELVGGASPDPDGGTDGGGPLQDGGEDGGDGGGCDCRTAPGATSAGIPTLLGSLL